MRPPTGQRRPWPRRPISASPRCNASGRPTACGPTACAAFKLSNDPKFADKLRDVVGLYIDPPAHAVVLSLDEKSQIQALDRTQPGLPMKKGRAGDHDPRLQAPWHDHPVRRPRRAGGQGRGPLHAAPPPSGVHPLPKCRGTAGPPPERTFTPSSITTPPTSTPRCASGWPGIRAGASTSLPRPAHG